MIRYLGKLEEIDLSQLHGENVSSTIEKYQKEIYEKFIEDLDFSFKGKEYKKVLIQIPKSHIKGFLLILVNKKNSSVLRNSEVNIVEIDAKAIEHTIKIHEVYKKYLDIIFAHNKFVEIHDTGNEMESFTKNEIHKKEVSQAFTDFMKELLDWTAQNPKLKTYFPSQEQADLENMSLEEFYKLYMKVSSLDWKEISQANEELVSLFRKYDYVKIVGDNADITFSIKGMGAKNSVIDANYPGTEVFSAPVKNAVDGWIYYPNNVFFKFSGDMFPNPYFEFKNGKLVKFEIRGAKSKEEKQRLEKIFFDKVNGKEGNNYLGELAFGTNPFVPVGIKHKLIGEKAFGMHFALGRAYKYPEVNNGNNDASIHWDAIRTLKDNTKVYFGNNKEELLVIDNGIYNKDICPKLHKFSLLAS